MIGHHDIKKILIKSPLWNEPVHVLLVGSPGSAKTLFLMEIIRSFRSCLFVVASNRTKAGLVNQLFERRPKFTLIDELEKMKKNDQTSLLHLMETGIIAETKIGRIRQIQVTSRVFATANSCKNIIEPLLSRFLVVEIQEYTFEEFREIAVMRLEKENVNETSAVMIA